MIPSPRLAFPQWRFPAGAWRHSQASRQRCQPTRRETDRCPDIGHGAFFVIAPKPAKTSRTAAVSLATNSARDASLHRMPPAGGPHRAACRTRPGQEVFCCLITVLLLWWGSHAAAGTPLAVGVQVMMCTSSPPPRPMTRDLMLAAGRSYRAAPGRAARGGQPAGARVQRGGISS
jgi:hypothetical protein